MANVNEGLVVGGEEGLDPNRQSDFDAILEGRGVPKEEGDGRPSTDVRSGLTTAEPGQAREPETGRFVAKETKQTPAPDTSQKTGADTSSVTDVGRDPEVVAFLAKYNDDPEAALKAAASATALIGRQGQELGQTREELAELRGQIAALTAVAQQAPQAPLATVEQVETHAQALIGSTASYFDAATQAANLSLESGDNRVYDSILEQWALEQPIQAQRFDLDFQMWLRDQRNAAAAPATPAAPAWVAEAEQNYKVGGIESALRSIAAEYSPEDWQGVAEHFDAALDSMPKNVLAMIDSTDAEARQAGTQLVVDRASLLAARAAAASPATPAEPTEQQVPASVARKLAGAAVASSALKQPSRTATPQTREDAIAEFKRQIVEAPTTNVASGLTYGPTP